MKLGNHGPFNIKKTLKICQNACERFVRKSESKHEAINEKTTNT